MHSHFVCSLLSVGASSMLLSFFILLYRQVQKSINRRALFIFESLVRSLTLCFQHHRHPVLHEQDGQVCVCLQRPSCPSRPLNAHALAQLAARLACLHKCSKLRAKLSSRAASALALQLSLPLRGRSASSTAVLTATVSRTLRICDALAQSLRFGATTGTAAS